MNAEYTVAPGVPGPYAHPSAGAPVQVPVGQAGPAEVVRPQMPSVSQPGVYAMNQPGAVAPQHPGQQGTVPSVQHPQAVQHPQSAHAAPTVPPTGGAHQGATPAGVGAPQVPGPSGSAPVRSPLRTGSEAVNSGEPDEEKGGMLGGLLRIVKREKHESDEGPESSTQLKKKGVGPRRVRAMLTTVDPWSIMKLAFLFSIAVGIVLVVAVAIIWNVLNAMGVFASINEQITTILGPESKTTFLQFTDRNKIMSVTILLAVVNSILMTGLATIGAFLYNLVVKLVGGVYITLTDE